MTSALRAIGFDADDTLWHNESLFSLGQEKFRALLAPYHSAEWINRTLYETELRNLAHFGYGIKGFALSMIETAVELTEGRISGSEIGQILALAKAMVAAPVELLPGVEEIVPRLAQSYPLLLITKGDLFDQEGKLAASGLGDLFDAVEIVSDKNASTYHRVFHRHADGPERAMMVGNSLKSDIVPAIGVTTVPPLRKMCPDRLPLLPLTRKPKRPITPLVSW